MEHLRWKMNILILTEKYPPDAGGLAVSSRRLARGLAQAGHTVWVSTLTSSVAPGAAIASDEDGLTVLRVGAHRRADDTLADWFGQVVAFHSALEWDLIHAMYITRPAFVAVTAARYLQRPSVISARGNDLDRTAFDPAKFSQVLWSLQHADAITAVTTDLARKARALVPGREVHCIPNGVDTQLFAPGLRDEALAESLDLGDAPVVAFVGEARRKKGLTILLPAYGHLGIQGERPPVLLLIGGVRRDDMPVLEVFRRQNPSLDIRIVPNVAHEQLPAYYHLADLLVFPSLRDGMPNALLEGMACGKAVVASKVGGMPEVLRGDDPENGLLVPPGDPIALAEAMGALLADRSRRERMGRAARATVEAEFTPERETSRNLEIYRAVMGSA